MKKSILIIDDTALNRDMLSMILEEDYETIYKASNGLEGIKAIDKYSDSLIAILLDLIMPVMDGIQVLEYMKKKNLTEKIPVIIISTSNSSSVEKQALDLGAADFIKKPFDTALIRRRVKNISELYIYKENLENTVEDQIKELKEQAESLKQSKLNIIDVIGTIVESRNLESGEHIQRVKKYTNIIANKVMQEYPEYNLTAELVEIITNASSLHDIGKIAIPDSILLKPGKLTSEEFEIMKSHTIEGSKMITNIDNVWDQLYDEISYNITRYHHERFNGKGYPDGLSGDDIPIEAQIVSIADVYDALINVRCYKDAYSKDKAFEMILNGECGEFNPKIINCFKLVKDVL